MIINEVLKERGITMYKLAQLSEVPQATISGICSGKSDIMKCSAGSLYKIARTLEISMEEIIESAEADSRPSIERFKESVQSEIETIGELCFLLKLDSDNRIRRLYEKGWVQEAAYLLDVFDELTEKNQAHYFRGYEDVRRKLQKRKKLDKTNA